MKKILILMFGLSCVNSCHAGALPCNKVAEAMVNLSSPDVRPYCDTAELRCHALSKLQKLPKDDVLRVSLEPKLDAQVEYELEVCEVAIREIAPDYLPPIVVE